MRGNIRSFHKGCVLLVALTILLLSSCADRVGGSDEEKKGPEPSIVDKETRYYIDDKNDDHEKTYKNPNSCAVVFIIGRHANAQMFPEDMFEILVNGYRILDDAVYGGIVGLIIADGTPSVIDLQKLDDITFAEDAGSQKKLKERIDERKKACIKLLQGAEKADDSYGYDSDGTDLLHALREAGTFFYGDGHPNLDIKKRILVIADTGLSTRGEINLSEIDFSEEIDDVIPDMNDQYPTLKDVECYIVGWGNYNWMAPEMEPQPELGPKGKSYIRDLWVEVLKRSGVKGEQITYVSLDKWRSNVPEDGHTVEVVNLPPDLTPDTPPDTAPPEQPEEADPEETAIEKLPVIHQSIEFKNGTTDFLLHDESCAQLEELAGKLKDIQDDTQHLKENIWIIGTSATEKDGDEGEIGLSLDRAEKVKELLINYGVSDSVHLFTIGVGAKNPWHITEFEDDHFIEDRAERNRTVQILSENDENEAFSMFEDYMDNEQYSDAVKERYLLFKQLGHN